MGIVSLGLVGWAVWVDSWQVGLIEIAVIVLSPMIPALILYAVLPSRATVSGPFKGLNIRLQGAFGGYFVLVLVVVGVVMEQRLSDDPWPRYETWKMGDS